MTTVSITDLRYHFPKVELLLRRHRELLITRRGKVFARLILPLDQSKPK